MERIVRPPSERKIKVLKALSEATGPADMSPQALADKAGVTQGYVAQVRLNDEPGRIQDGPLGRATRTRITWHKIVPRGGPPYYKGFLGSVHIMHLRPSVFKHGYWEVQSFLPEQHTRQGSPAPYVKDLDDARLLAEEVIQAWLRITGLDKEMKA